MLLSQILHRNASGDFQSVRVISDRAECVAARETALDDVRERLAAIAPRRMHLKIAAIVLQARARQLPIL